MSTITKTIEKLPGIKNAIAWRSRRRKKKLQDYKKKLLSKGSDFSNICLPCKNKFETGTDANLYNDCIDKTLFADERSNIIKMCGIPDFSYTGPQKNTKGGRKRRSRRKSRRGNKSRKSRRKRRKSRKKRKRRTRRRRRR